ncbi:MAG: tRNA uridine-5-carboxymethylaminomethyl(34) synthesis enzyme MnmG [Acholeplasmatales bacterium]|nr:tRNA uridine-5-carboxymethylaminomethyl(34) synthesis enzyme MnmG [Acholeplasmatales bacterium]
MYDVIVVGGGHAGCEACLAAANIGKKTLLVTGALNRVGSMPCNPSIGGPAKGIVVREIDALGGYMGKNADMCQIQMKMLNSSKGPAVRALRCQADKTLYPKYMLKHLKETKNLDLKEALVDGIIVNDNTVGGVILTTGERIESKTVILTTGTYLNSRTLRGFDFKYEGPDNQPTTYGISKQLSDLGFSVQRLKTGTPPRIVTSSIDFSKSQREPGDTYPWKFSFDKGYDQIEKVNVDCALIYTNKEIHKIINDNLEKSSMYGGVIEGVGPRYCPSIETKVVRFADKERHQIFLEPEGLTIPETYIGGFSTSMPIDIQDKMIRLLPGLENCVVARYAYAIEYDAINPIELWPSLETKLIKGLFTAGQINGTSGYEEAACQGLMAGINACAKLNGKEPLILKRDEAYIGVLIDDLVTKGTDEPYRLLTSRAEYRLLLRNDNADIRLRKYGHEYGLISDEQMERLNLKINNISILEEILKKNRFKKNEENNKYLESIGSTPMLESTLYYDLLKRPEISSDNILEMLKISNQLSIVEGIDDISDIMTEVEILLKYQGYINKAFNQAEKMKSLDERKIPDDINYNDVHNLATEAREKLMKVLPKTIGQASRIMGVNPADIAVLIVYLEGLHYGVKR